MIRLPHSSIYDLTARLLAANSVKLGVAEEQAATGRRINRPSDAPADLAEVHQLSAAMADQEGYKSNADSAVGELDAMDAALGQAGDIVVRAREIAVAMASDSASADDRAAAAVEVRGLQESMATAANATFNDRYLFAGTAFTTQPFDTTGAYAGSTAEPSTQVADSRWVKTGLDGSAVFTGAADIFGTLEALAVALEANDPSAVQTTLTDLETSTDMLTDARAEVGAETNAALDAVDNAESLAAMFDRRLGQLINVDPATAYSKLAELRNAYEATLQVAGSASSRSLLDYLS